MNWLPLEGLTEWPDGTPIDILLWGHGSFMSIERTSITPIEFLMQGYTHYAIITGPDEQDQSEWNAAVDKCAELFENTSSTQDAMNAKAIRKLKRPE